MIKISQICKKLFIIANKLDNDKQHEIADKISNLGIRLAEIKAPSSSYWSPNNFALNDTASPYGYNKIRSYDPFIKTDQEVKGSPQEFKGGQNPWDSNLFNMMNLYGQAYFNAANKNMSQYTNGQQQLLNNQHPNMSQTNTYMNEDPNIIRARERMYEQLVKGTYH